MAITKMSSGPVFANSDDQIRFMAKVARMYHERGMRQGEIASELHISQPRVSRLLKRGAELGIIQTTVTLPQGVFTQLEEEIEQKYGLQTAIVVDAEGDERDINYALGSATAEYLSATLIGTDTVGISSWSASLLASVDAMRPFRSQVVDSVTQVVGGLGNPAVEVLAARLLSQFANLTGAEAVFLPAPGTMAKADATRALLKDPSVSRVLDLWKRLTLVLVGIGAVQPSEMLRQSGNAVTPEEEAEIIAAGAVGDICLRFFDAEGKPVQSDFNNRIVGIGTEDLLAIPRRVGVAGSSRKHQAIRAAVLGGWVNVLITDIGTAQYLLG